MVRISKQKACIACTESKRRCDKRLPGCTRCDDRDVDCQYPPSKRRRHHQLQKPLPDQALPAPGPGTLTADMLVFDSGPLASGIWNMPWSDLDFTPDTQAPAEAAAATLDAPQQQTPATNPHEEARAKPHNHYHHPQQQQQKQQHDPSPVETSLAGSKWFLAPATWRIEHWPTPSHDAYPTFVLDNFTRGLQAWVRRWVTDGHSPFIHRSLYAEGNHFPSCVQDALTAASLYHHKTPQNVALVYHILDERVAALMAMNLILDNDRLAAPPLETREHLARVHALSVYTIIRLFDGSISQRAAAEADLPTLDLWKRQLWDSAMRDAETLTRARGPPPSKWCPQGSSPSTGQEVAAAAATTGTVSDSGGGSGDGSTARYQGAADTYESDLLTWNLWVLSESIRRTWTVVTWTVGIYNALRGNWGVCAGGALFTARAGLWDAPSAPRWAALCREAENRRDGDARPGSENSSNGGDRNFFVPSVHGGGLIHNAAAAEVDEFARHLFTCVWGLDRVEDWALRTAAKGEVNLIY
ncbi:hypothetical protein EsH8_IX_000079 [Colletotrichum jinshuiense]